MNGPLRLTVLGTGYLGITHAACMASLGFEVLGVDTDPQKVDLLNAGQLPIYEPGLREHLRSGLDSGRLAFTTSYPRAAAFGDMHFICAGTPPQPGSDYADLSQVQGCVAALAPLLDRPCLVAGKSTVPVVRQPHFASLTRAISASRASLVRLWNHRERAWWRRVQASQWMTSHRGRGRVVRAASSRLISGMVSGIMPGSAGGG